MQRIAARLAVKNLSEREASIEATGKPDLIRYVKTRRHMPSADKLESLAAVLGTTSAWLLGGDAPAEVRDVPSLSSLRRLARDLPVYGTALAADLDVNVLEGEGFAVEQVEINMTDALDFMARPAALAGRKDVYVVVVAGFSMMPRHDTGRRLLVNPAIPPTIGDDVVVQLKRALGDEGDAEMSAILIKQLVRRRPGVLVLRQFNPETTFEISMDKVHAVHRVQPWDEALGI